MENQTEKIRISRIEKPRWKETSSVTFPKTSSRNEDLTFSFPAFPNSDVFSLIKDLYKHGLRPPTPQETTTLVYNAFFNKEHESTPEMNTVRNLFLEAYHQYPMFKSIVYNTDDEENIKGGFILDDIDLFTGTVPTDIKELEKLISDSAVEEGIQYSKDRKVCYVPYNRMPLGEQTPAKLSENGLVIALVGKDMAKMYGEIAAQFSKAVITHPFHDHHLSSLALPREISLDRINCINGFGFNTELFHTPRLGFFTTFGVKDSILKYLVNGKNKNYITSEKSGNEYSQPKINEMEKYSTEAMESYSQESAYTKMHI